MVQGQGLSPRVRGNRVTRLTRNRIWGSIPACAGEPQLHFGSRLSYVVYPRVCGGTGRQLMKQTNLDGLSPRVRGNRSRNAQGKIG